MKESILGWVAGALLLSVWIAGCGGGIGGGRNVIHEAVEETTAEVNGEKVVTIVKTQFVQEYGVLNLIATLAALATAAAILARGFGIPVHGGAIGSGLLLTVGCWMLRIMLVKYLPLAALLGVIALIVSSVGLAYGHRNWLERRLNVDLDRDGDIGKD